METEFTNYTQATPDATTVSQIDTSEEDKQALQTARGVTATNPYGYNNPFQGVADFFGVDVSYENIFDSPRDIASIAEQGYQRYTNPMQSGVDLSRGFGSLFSRPTGEQTQMGVIREQKPDPLSGEKTAGLMGFSLLGGGGLPSLIANLNANPSTFVPERASEYDATRDPTSDLYDKDIYDKSFIESSIDAMFGEGATQRTTEAVEEAVKYLTNAGKP